MISDKELKYLTVYLRPYKYKCISEGKRIELPSLSENITENEDEEQENYIYSFWDNDLYESDNVDGDKNYYMSRIWFEIVGMSHDFKEKHIGFITGYYINADEVTDDISWGDGEGSFYEFDSNSKLTSDLWHYITKFDTNEFLSNYYFMNSITLDKYYDLPIIEETAINLIRNALWTIYEYEIRTIIYSIGFTELDDFTVGENYGDTDELSFQRHRKNILNMGFKSYKNEQDEEVYLYNNKLCTN